MVKTILSLYDYIGNILFVVSIILAMLTIAPEKKNDSQPDSSKASTDEAEQYKSSKRKQKGSSVFL